MNAKPPTHPCAQWCSLSSGLKGGDVGSFSRSKDQPPASLMHSLSVLPSLGGSLSLLELVQDITFAFQGSTH